MMEQQMSNHSMFLVESSSEQKDSLARYHIANLAPEKDGIGTNSE